MLGVLVFILTLFLLVLVHEYGHYATARFFKVGVEEFGIGFPPAIARWAKGKTVISLNWIPLGGFVRIKGEDENDRSPDSFSVQPVYKRALIIAAGVIMNALVAVALFSIGFGIGMPQDITDGAPAATTVTSATHRVMAVVPDAPADGVIADGDSMVALDGHTFSSLQDLQGYVRAHADQPVAVTISKEGTQRTVTLTPTALAIEGTAEPVIGFGVQLSTIGIVRYPWYQAPVEGLKMTGESFVLIVTTLGNALGNLVRGSPAGIDIAGPVGIAVVTGNVVHLGFLYLLQFVALLSINLSFVNLLPLPALDGGRLLFILIEAVRRKPVPSHVESRIHQIGFSFLLLLVLVVTFFDISRLHLAVPHLW
ncbi:RIP metalloprotease RseP [Candidatus Uhrbacteria bacterium CG10_big_fil_rev_8_21_14_0_10_48_11]|uniref:Zinc metalloprotease n=1 Tax=Candidatus Uhrbacteria bacterium CG10_big_fil_rev_8_21_14_0_10_48_11 TaxID=1975037 RepID=A0A2M8LDZ3_9BACT|nr:MAG: RIP metalloprotease RseP [Candidatus Uhrbacteria bacterium CG10_big_fil_rev_8_21_14_0_10_48_11]